MHFSFMNVVLLYSDHRHVSATLYGHLQGGKCKNTNIFIVLLNSLRMAPGCRKHVAVVCCIICVLYCIVLSTFCWLIHYM
jgi:hypothetical protein